jgi:hypothetical protein
MESRGEVPKWVKPFASVTDYVDICGRHSLITTPRLFGLRADFNPKGRDVLEQSEEIQKLQEEHPGLDLQDATDLDAIHKKLDKLKTSLHAMDLLAPPHIPEELRKLSKFVWLKDGEGSYHLGLMSGEMVSARENTLGQYEIFKHNKGVRVLIHVAKDLKEAITTAENEIPSVDRKVMTADASWRKEPCTEKQVWKLFSLDRRLKAEFSTAAALYQFAKARFDAGDSTYSRGAISQKIDSLMTTKR